MKRFGIVTGLVLIDAVPVAMTIAEEEAVEMKDLPAAVHKTLAAEAGNAPILEIEKETEDGQTVYEAEIKKEAEIVEVEIAEDGTLLKSEAEKEDGDDDGENEEKDGDDEAEESEESVALGDLPEAVQKRMQTDYAGKACTFAVEKEAGVTYYEAEYEEDGAAHSVKMTEGGDVIELETEVTALPEAVAAHIKRTHPKATIKEAESVQLHFYEVELQSGKKTHEIRVLANGQEIGEEEEEEEEEEEKN